jgi:hypothetical protein
MQPSRCRWDAYRSFGWEVVTSQKPAKCTFRTTCKKIHTKTRASRHKWALEETPSAIQAVNDEQEERVLTELRGMPALGKTRL